MNKTMHLGKKFELRFLADLDEGISKKIQYQIFTPFLDDNGIDYVIRKSNGEYIEIQIKARDKKRLFTIKNDFKARDNYWFVFYCEDNNEYKAYILPSKYVKKELENKASKHITINKNMKYNNFEDIFNA